MPKLHATCCYTQIDEYDLNESGPFMFRAISSRQSGRVKVSSCHLRHLNVLRVSLNPVLEEQMGCLLPTCLNLIPRASSSRNEHVNMNKQLIPQKRFPPILADAGQQGRWSRMKPRMTVAHAANGSHPGHHNLANHYRGMPGMLLPHLNTFTWIINPFTYNYKTPENPNRM